MLYGANRAHFKWNSFTSGRRSPQLSRRDRALLRLRHPHIAPLYLDRQCATPCVATESMPGPTLADQLAWRRAVPFGLPEVLETLTPVADALTYAHAQGVAHGNLFPGAIVQMPDGPVLTGFATAEAGSRAYQSPDATAPTPSSDVYALALIVHEMLTGTLPGGTRSGRRLPRGIDHVLARALAHDPRQRPATPLRFLHSLETTPEYTSYFGACRARLRRQRQTLVIASFSFALMLVVAAALLGTVVATQF